MQHTSIKLNTSCEPINITSVNPLISKCEIKVCYVSDEPNRNRSILTKKVATEMAKSLPGSPIVGFYDKEKKDFLGHAEEIIFQNGEFKFKDITRPYGFVDINARVWFQKFLDDSQVEREYLMTEGFLWTKAYPECQRILDKGNNQSIELFDDENFLDGHWTKSDSDGPSLFIINEALISKLCILGEDQEPCFEGARITNLKFSFDENSQKIMSNMMVQLQEILSKGEAEKMSNDFKKTEDGKEKKQFALESSQNDSRENKQYNLDDIPEYIELKSNYDLMKEHERELEATIAEWNDRYRLLEDEVKELRQFKADVEHQQKEEMIAKFDMLSDAEKLDVVSHIDEYTLDEVESKLSVIWARKSKPNFSFKQGKNESKSEAEDAVKPITYNLVQDDTTPAWIRAVQRTKEEKDL